MLGRQFQDRLFAFGWHELLIERVPKFARTIFVPDMTVVGAALGVIGIVWLLRRRVSAAILLATGAVAILAFALNYSVIDTPVFLIPSLLVAWLLAAVGAEQVVSRLPARAWIGSASVVFCLIPAWLFATNFKLSDRSRDTRAAIELDRLFQALPDRASIVSEDFIADRMVTAKLLGDDAANGRHIELADPDSNLLRQRLEAGEAVFAFRKSAQTLRFDGLDVGFQPLRLIEGPLDGFLSRLPDGAIVAIGVPAAQGGAFIATAGTSLETIGGPSDLAVLAGLNLAVVGVRGRTGACDSGRTVRYDTRCGRGETGWRNAAGRRWPTSTCMSNPSRRPFGRATVSWCDRPRAS